MKQKPKNKLPSQKIILLYSSAYYFSPHTLTFFLSFFFFLFCWLTSRGEGGNHILEFLLLYAFFPFFSTEQMFHTSASLLTKAAFFCWGRDAAKEIFLRALVPNFFSFPVALPVPPARAQERACPPGYPSTPACLERSPSLAHCLQGGFYKNGTITETAINGSKQLSLTSAVTVP